MSPAGHLAMEHDPARIWVQANHMPYGISYYVFFDHLMDSVAQLVTRLAGE